MGTQGQAFLERLTSEVLVLDGAMGTMLFAAGLGSGDCPELWNDTHPEVLQKIHQAYLDAGSDLVETNTFGGTRLKLKAYGFQDRAGELNLKGAQIARSVCPPGKYVAGSIGPTGHLPDIFEPMGDTPAEAFYENFREQALALAEGGVDLFAVETMMIPEEAVIAVRAAKEATGLPVMCSMTFQWGRGMAWTEPCGGPARRWRPACCARPGPMWWGATAGMAGRTAFPSSCGRCSRPLRDSSWHTRTPACRGS
jgi:5-methyltetrahydrofolate--homocysteine methyltransferase